MEGMFLQGPGLRRMVWLVVMDGLPGLEEAVKRVFPQADIQRCMAHKRRQTRHQVQRKEWEAVHQDLKVLLDAPDRATAQQRFAAFRERGEKRYPRVVVSWARDLDHLLTFLAAAQEAWQRLFAHRYPELTQKA